METVNFEGTIEEYQGKKDWPGITLPINYNGSYEAFTSPQEVKDAGEWPNDGAVLKMVNTRRLSTAKAAEYQKQTAKLKEKYEESDDYKWKQIYEASVAAFGDNEKGRARAKKLADATMADAKENSE